MGHQHQRKSDAKYAQKRHKQSAEREELYSAESRDTFGLSPNGILNLQHTIGNQAVQRLIVQREPGNGDVIPADAKPKDKGGTAKKTPSVLASITGSNQGKFEGESSIKGHEGKIEAESVNFTPKERFMTVQIVKVVDKSSGAFTKAFIAGESLTLGQFDFIRTKDDGEMETVQSFEFNDGMITSIQYGNSEGVAFETITIEFALKPEKREKERE